MKRPLAALCLALAALVIPAGSAIAAWQPIGGSTGNASAQALGKPTAPGATATGSSSITVSWSAPIGLAPSQYIVRRTAPTTATVCSVPGGTFSCTDTGLSGGTSYSYTVEAALGASWLSGQTSPVSATTSTAPTFVVTVSGTQTAGTAFGVTIRATTDGVTTDTSYTGSHTLTFSGPSTSPNGTAPIYPGTVSFTAGVATGTITLTDAQTATLLVSDGVRSGSTPVTVQAGTASTLVYSSSNISCASGIVVGNGGSFITKVSVVDADGNLQTVPSLLIALTFTPASGTLVPTTLQITNGSETTGSATYTLQKGNPPAVTLTASAAGYTSAACVVKKK